MFSINTLFNVINLFTFSFSTRQKTAGGHETFLALGGSARSLIQFSGVPRLARTSLNLHFKREVVHLQVVYVWTAGLPKLSLKCVFPPNTC